MNCVHKGAGEKTCEKVKVQKRGTFAAATLSRIDKVRGRLAEIRYCNPKRVSMNEVVNHLLDAAGY